MQLRQLALAATLFFTLPALTQTTANTLTKQEAAAGWHLLWDGKTTDGWVSAKHPGFPEGGWVIKNGLFTVTDHEGEDGGNAGDIMTTRKYGNFELSVDFRTVRGANSGIKYFVDPDKTGKSIGCEYQILDDAVHPDAKKGKDGNRTQGSLYDVIPATGALDHTKPDRPVGQWNTARIVVNGAHVEHWLNGKKVVEYERFTPHFRELIAESKFKTIPHFGELTEGYILLQDHGFPVSFRNIKIRELPPTPAK